MARTLYPFEGANRSESAGIAIGVAIVILGIVAVIFPITTTLTAELLLGGLLAIAGMFRAITAWLVAPGARGFGFRLLSGLVMLAAGLLLLFYPLAGAISLALVVAVLFVVDGVFRTVTALRERPHGRWGGLLFSGVLSLVLGLILLLFWPYAAASLLGLLLGIDLIVTGIYQLALTRTAGETHRLP